MTRRMPNLFLLAPAAMLALVLGACSLSSKSDQSTKEDAVNNRVIIDDLRAPSRQNY